MVRGQYSQRFIDAERYVSCEKGVAADEVLKKPVPPTLLLAPKIYTTLKEWAHFSSTKRRITMNRHVAGSKLQVPCVDIWLNCPAICGGQFSVLDCSQRPGFKVTGRNVLFRKRSAPIDVLAAIDVLQMARSTHLGNAMEVLIPSRRRKMAYKTWRRNTNDPQFSKSCSTEHNY